MIFDSYFHCMKCWDELPEGESPRGWAKLEVCFTDEGLRVRCVRHGCDVVALERSTVGAAKPTYTFSGNTDAPSLGLAPALHYRVMGAPAAGGPDPFLRA
jgi:hypothetical protein